MKKTLDRPDQSVYDAFEGYTAEDRRGPSEEGHLNLEVLRIMWAERNARYGAVTLTPSAIEAIKQWRLAEVAELPRDVRTNIRIAAAEVLRWMPPSAR